MLHTMLDQSNCEATSCGNPQCIKGMAAVAALAAVAAVALASVDVAALAAGTTKQPTYLF